MGATDDEVRIYRGTVDPRPGGRCSIEVEALNGTYLLINHTDSDLARGSGGAGSSTLAERVVTPSDPHLQESSSLALQMQASSLH